MTQQHCNRVCNWTYFHQFLNVLCSHKEWGNETFFLQKYICLSLFLSKGIRASMVCERDRDKGRQRQTDILTHNFLAALWDTAPVKCPATYWRSRDWPNLFWSQAETDSKLTLSYVGICIYHFTTPTIPIQPCDYFHSFTQVYTVQRNLWLMVWSRVNMQHSSPPYFQNVYLWTFSSHPSPSLSTSKSYK